MKQMLINKQNIKQTGIGANIIPIQRVKSDIFKFLAEMSLENLEEIDPIQSSNYSNQKNWKIIF